MAVKVMGFLLPFPLFRQQHIYPHHSFFLFLDEMSSSPFLPPPRYIGISFFLSYGFKPLLIFIPSMDRPAFFPLVRTVFDASSFFLLYFMIALLVSFSR